MDTQATHPEDWRQGVDARLLSRLWRRARQPGLVPMGLVRRVHARVQALSEHLEWLTRLNRRYAVGGGAGTEHVPIILASWPPGPPPRVSAPPATLTVPLERGGEPPVRVVVKAVTRISRESAVPPPPSRESPRVDAPLPRGGALRAPPLPRAPSPPRASQAWVSPVPALRARSAATGEGAPSEEEAAPGPAPVPLVLVKPLAPPAATPAEGAPAQASPPSLPRVRPVPPVEGTPTAGARDVAPSPVLPRVVPRQPSGAAQRVGEGPPLVHPASSPPPAAGSPPPVQEVHFPMAPREPAAAPLAPAPHASRPRQEAAPVPPQLDLEVLTRKVRQRLLRQFDEEKVRRGGLK